MFKPDSEEAVWLHYITKLNDRALSKRQTSGFTTWAICGILAILSFKILNILPILTNTPDIRFLFLVVISTSVNLSISILYLLAGFYMYGTPTSEIRLKTRLSHVTEHLLYVPLLVIGIPIVYISFYTGCTDKPYYLPWWPYYLLGVFYILNLLIPLGKGIKTFIKFKKEYKEIPHLAESPFFSKSPAKLFVMLGIIIVGIFLTCCSFSAVYYLLKNSPILNHINLIKYSFEIIAILILTLILLGRIATGAKEQFLEALELKIVLDELNPDQIKEIFIKEFLGKKVLDWVLLIESESKTLSNNYYMAVESAKKEFNKINETLKDWKNVKVNDLSTHLKKVETHVGKYGTCLEEYGSYIKKAIKQVEYLQREGAFISDNELLQKITIPWTSQHNKIIASFDTINEHYKLICETSKKSIQEIEKLKVEQRGEDDTGNRAT